MARPRTMSDPIRFRLPLPNYAVLERKAKARGRTVEEHVQAVLIRSTDVELPESERTTS